MHKNPDKGLDKSSANPRQILVNHRPGEVGKWGSGHAVISRMIRRHFLLSDDKRGSRDSCLVSWYMSSHHHHHHHHHHHQPPYDASTLCNHDVKTPHPKQVSS